MRALCIVWLHAEADARQCAVYGAYDTEQQDSGYTDDEPYACRRIALDGCYGIIVGVDKHSFYHQ